MLQHKASAPLKLFFSYSHKDEELRDELAEHLGMLKRDGVIDQWHDRKIGAGNEIEGHIDEHLNSSSILLLLISASFINSNYCYDKEMIRAMERHNLREARVIPVILRPCDWHSAPFGKLNALPTDGKAVTGERWKTRDDAYLDITNGIRAAAADITKNRK